MKYICQYVRSLRGLRVQIGHRIWGVKKTEKHRTPFRNIPLSSGYESVVKMSVFHQFLQSRNIPRIDFTGYEALLANTRILLRSDIFTDKILYQFNLCTTFSVEKKDLDLFLVCTYYST